MGHIQNLAGHIEETENADFVPKPERYTVSIRIDGMQLQYLDMLAVKTGLRRGAMGKEVLVSGIMDLMDSLGVTEEFYNKLKPTDVYLKEWKERETANVQR